MVLGASLVHAVQINVGSATIGTAGGQVAIPVTLVSEGQQVAGTQNDIVFDPDQADLARVQDCVINPAISDRAEGCEDDPTSGPCKQLNRNLADCPAAQGCPTGSEGLRRFRAIILSLANTTAIPDGVLYTCTFNVASGLAEGTMIELQNLNFGSSNPGGQPLTTTGANGVIEIIGVPPTDTPTPQPTSTNTPRPTDTRPPPTATNTPAPGGDDDDDGCQIVAPANSSVGWMLLIPVGALLWLRRRSR
jgi:hypothetical protein